VIDLWLQTFADLLVTALIERIMERSQVMFSSKVILWGGVASVVAGLFWLMTGLAPSSGDATLELAFVLSLGGLVGLFSRQAGQGGRLGLAGFALGILGPVLALASLLIADVNPETNPVGAAPGVLILFLGLVTLGMGLALLGVTSLRAKTLPHWQGLPLGLGLLNIIEGVILWFFYYVPMSQGQNPFHPWPPEGYTLTVAGFVLLGLGWMGLGTMLATEAEAKVAQTPPPASA